MPGKPLSGDLVLAESEGQIAVAFAFEDRKSLLDVCALTRSPRSKGVSGRKCDRPRRLLGSLEHWHTPSAVSADAGATRRRFSADRFQPEQREVLLASVNATFTWVRLAQRMPVRIRLTDVPAGVLIAAGMTCTVTLKNEI
jgi:hypothetical protein